MDLRLSGINRLTVKAATLIFIYWHGSAISSAKQGKSGFIYNLLKIIISCLDRANVRAFHENPNRTVQKQKPYTY